MPIYSNNRTGSMALAQVAANESYTSEDFGRILYESQLNDMAFFEAILTCDFKEINGLREGTILESEVKALNEASFKEMVEKVVAGLKKFWAKIKAAFVDAINKLGAWVGKNGKSLAKQVKELKMKEKWNGSIENVVTYDYSNEKLATLKGDMYNELFRAVGEKDINTAAIAGEYLGRLVGAGHSVSVAEYSKMSFEHAKGLETLNKSNIDQFVKDMDSASFHIAFMKKYQKRVEDSINSWIKDLREAAKEEQNANKLNGIVRAYETIVAAMCRTNIAITRADLKSKAAAVTRALADARKHVNEATEMEVRCVMDTFDEAMINKLDMDDETRAVVAELVGA